MHFPFLVLSPNAHRRFVCAFEEESVCHPHQAGTLKQALYNSLKPRKRPDAAGALSREHLSYDLICGVRP